MLLVQFYTRPNCHLCHQVLETLRELQKEVNFRINLIDISLSEDLEKLHGKDIPIVTLNGKVILKHRVDEDELRRILRSVD